MTTARVELPDKLVPVFTGPARYRGAYGGRGSGKSFSFAKMLAVRGYARPLRILCGREIQNSIKESSMAEVIRAIDSEPWLARHYDYGESFIRGANGTEFIFKGLKHNARGIKSMAAINIAWIEEAEAVSEESWRSLIRFFVLRNRLFVDHEAWGVGVELDRIPAFYDAVPGARKWPIKADAARPETISYLRRQGFNISAAEKWRGSVEDGITHLKGYDGIVIHERCRHTAAEFSKYSHKIDRRTGDVLPAIVDKWNHCIDAIRYGHDGLIQRRGSMDVWARLAL